MNQQFDGQQSAPPDEEMLPLSQQIFADYFTRLADRTRKRQRTELAGLRDFLKQIEHPVGNLAFDAATWMGVKSEDVKQYLASLQEKHYSASSLSNLLYTIKTYARLAMDHRFFDRSEYQRLDAIEIKPVEEGQPRIGKQKPTPLSISDEQAKQLLMRPDTRRGRTDALLMALFLRCGLWPREIAALNRRSIDAAGGIIAFYNYNAEEEQILKLDPLTLEIAKRYLQDDSPYEALFVGNHKESTKAQRLTDRAMNARVRALGAQVGLSTLSPRDCHAYWEQAQERERRQKGGFVVIGSSGSGKTRALLRLMDGYIDQQGELPTPTTKRPPRRKKRPDVYNRRSLEERLHRQGVPDSLISPLVSEFRLVLPTGMRLLRRLIGKEGFVRQTQQDREKMKLSPHTTEIWELAFEEGVGWLEELLEEYIASKEEQ